MTVLKVGFVGIRSDRLDETVALFRDVIGVPVTRQTDDLVGFRLADGTVLELYGPTNEFHAFFTTGPVVAFRVDNFDVTRRAMLAAGVNFIGDVQHAGGVSWQHFYCPDGTVLEISGPGGGQTRQRLQPETRPSCGKHGHLFQRRMAASGHRRPFKLHQQNDRCTPDSCRLEHPSGSAESGQQETSRSSFKRRHTGCSFMRELRRKPMEKGRRA
jgi:catechol 2,3-dioxygenase-like lactoylglutathione lyase family enzyme